MKYSFLKYTLFLTCVILTFQGCQKQNTYALLNPIFQLGAIEKVHISKILGDYPTSEVIEYSASMAAPFKRQTQVNTQGVYVLGRERKVEFLFNNGVLGHIWIFFPQEELAVIKEQLVHEFGEIHITKPPYSVFKSKTVAIRTDPCEILLADAGLLYEIIGIE